MGWVDLVCGYVGIGGSEFFDVYFYVVELADVGDFDYGDDIDGFVLCL